MTEAQEHNHRLKGRAMRPSSNSTSASDDQPVALKIRMGAPDITLDCYNGHISLVEFVNLRPVISGQPQGFADAFRNDIYNKIEDTALEWKTGDLIFLKTGWVGENLLLVGFEQEMSVTVADNLMQSLTRSFRDVKAIRFADIESGDNHEIYLNNINPLYSMITRPKIMPYQSLASILINDVQSKKSVSCGSHFTTGEDYGSAIWASKPSQSVVSLLSAEEKRELNYQENTKRFLRKSFRDYKLHLVANPVVNLVTQQWESLNVSVSGLKTMMPNTDLDKETLASVAESLGMIWELDTATVDQALHDMTTAFGKAYQEEYRVNVPVALETVICWSRFKSDLIDVLDAYKPSVVEKVRLVITNIGEIIGVLDNRQLAKVNDWLKEIGNKYGIEFYAQWDKLDTQKATYQPLTVDGIKLSCETCNDLAMERAESVIKRRNQYSKALSIMLDDRFTEEATELAASYGAEFAEQRPLDANTTRTFREKLVNIQHRITEGRLNMGVVDARRRFRSTDKD